MAETESNARLRSGMVGRPHLARAGFPKMAAGTQPAFTAGL